MNNLQIEKKLLSNKYTAKYFLGTYTADTINSVKTVKGGLLINVCALKKGCHWTFAFRKNKRSKLEYFDSTSFKSFIFHQEINSFIKRHSSNFKNIIYNNTKIQYDKSIQCGKFAMLYFYFRVRDKTMKEFVSLFHHKPGRLEENDVIIKNLYKKHFIKEIDDLDMKKKCLGCKFCRN